jgi:Lipase (class 3)
MYPEYEHDTHQSSDDSCEPLSDHDLQQIVMYAPIALNFIYLERAVDMQLLAAQQGWRLLYSYLDQADVRLDRPASALFVLEDEKIACLAIRGTATIQDVVTDIRQVPTPFPMAEPSSTSIDEADWTAVSSGQGVAVSGMASAAYNLYREHHVILKLLAQDGYKIRLTGHSLGGSVATLLGLLVKLDLPDTASLHVYAYGPPSCVDFALADAMNSFVTTVVLHDDLVPRLTPTSCRSLLKHLLHIRETWVKTHLSSDIRAFKDRAKTAWAPKWRGGFTLSAASSSSRKLTRYCKKKLISGKKKLVRMKEKVSDAVSDAMSVNVNATRQPAVSIDHEDDYLGRDVTTSAIDELSALGGTVVEECPTCPVVDIMGGMDLASHGVVIDGEEFFDADDPVLDSSDKDSEGTESAPPGGAEDSVANSVLYPSAAWSADQNSLDDADDISAIILKS